MINCVVIDDEPLARECITNYIATIDFLHKIGEGNNPIDLVNILDTQKVDLIFLDIQMPKINGIDFLKTMSNLPLVVLTTAYPSYALEGFELNVLDYLLKPIMLKRFMQTANKAKEVFRLKAESQLLSDQGEEHYFFFKCDNKYEKVYFQDILFIQALQNYICIYTKERKYVSLLSLKSVEQKLIGKHFIKVHKSYIVSVPKITAVEPHCIVIHDKSVPVSRNYRKTVKDNIVSSKLWKND